MLTTLLDAAGAALIVAGVVMVLGVGPGLIVAGGGFLAVSWRFTQRGAK